VAQAGPHEIAAPRGLRRQADLAQHRLGRGSGGCRPGPAGAAARPGPRRTRAEARAVVAVEAPHPVHDDDVAARAAAAHHLEHDGAERGDGKGSTPDRAAAGVRGLVLLDGARQAEVAEPRITLCLVRLWRKRSGLKWIDQD
jgi:hypothetical protein